MDFQLFHITIGTLVFTDKWTTVSKLCQRRCNQG